MPNLTQTRKRIQAAMIGLLVLDAVAIAFLFSPLTAASSGNTLSIRPGTIFSSKLKKLGR